MITLTASTAFPSSQEKRGLQRAAIPRAQEGAGGGTGGCGQGSRGRGSGVRPGSGDQSSQEHSSSCIQPAPCPYSHPSYKSLLLTQHHPGPAKSNLLPSLGEAEDVPMAAPGLCPFANGTAGGDAWVWSSPGEDASLSSSSSCPTERPGCLDLAFLSPLDFLLEIPQVSTPPVTPCTHFFEIELKIRSVPPCSAPVSLLFACGARLLAALLLLSQPFCGRQRSRVGEIVSPLQKGYFWTQGLHLQGSGARPWVSSAGMWVWLHPLWEDGALLGPVGFPEGRLLCTEAADQQHEFPPPAVTPAPRYQDYPLSLPTHTEMKPKQKSFGTSLLHKQHCQGRGCRLGRAAVTATSLGDSHHPDRGAHQPPCVSHEEACGAQQGSPPVTPPPPPELSDPNAH